ncbi:MAG: hypothetical protein ACREO2_00490 [Arenimonas sp.]
MFQQVYYDLRQTSSVRMRSDSVVYAETAQRKWQAVRLPDIHFLTSNDEASACDISGHQA